MRQQNLSNLNQTKTEYILLVFTFLVSLMVLALINIFISSIYIVDEQQLARELSNLFIESVRYGILPEPKERLQYLVTIATAPLIIFFVYSISRRLISRASAPLLDDSYQLAFLLSATLLLLLIYLDLKVSPDNFIYKSDVTTDGSIRKFVALIISRHEAWLAVLTLPLAYYAVMSNFTGTFLRNIRLFLGILLALLLAEIFLINISDRDNYFGWYGHFNSVYYPVAQVVNGKTLLVDFANQYGLYPHFIAPIFKYIGLSAFKFSVLMCSLVVLSYAFLLLFLKNTLNNIALLFLGFIGLVYLRIFFLIFFSGGDSYFQYTPIRFIFPCLFLLLASYYFKSFSRPLYFAIFGISSFSLLWNLDTGIVVLVTWLAVLCFNELFDFQIRAFIKNCLSHILFGVAIFSLTLLSYTSLIYLSSGQFPDYSQFIKYQKLFYQSGFWMLPMPLFNAWNFLALIYGIGLIKAACSIHKNQKSYRSTIIFLLSILGIGLFSYYQGRSHDFLLTAINYPAFILLLVFADEWIEEIRLYGHRNSLPQIFYLSLTLIFLLILCFDIARPKQIYQLTTSRLLGTISNPLPNTQLTANIIFLKENTSIGEDILILTEPGYWDGLYYAETGTTNAVNMPGFSELILQEDYEKIIHFLKSNTTHKVFIDDDFNDNRVRSVLQGHYALIDQNNKIKAYSPAKVAAVTSITERLEGTARYNLVAPNEALVKNLDNFPPTRSLAEIQIELSDSVNLKRISISATKGIANVGGWTTRPIPHLWGIGIIDNESPVKLRNYGPRGNNLNLPIGRKLTLLVPDNGNLPGCPSLQIDMDYGNHGHLSINAGCK